ncbi:uncharacterized protein LOC132560731 [Ylistrum balloti]|uniref:uncharacterized protein LOC132560731 n=1 Tax=Ylistrum balloti TaxID=509963 RepID=UPI00290593DA|nr:uncharacterized protein LOC132560731 [Ylistrum balloti]
MNKIQYVRWYGVLCIVLLYGVNIIATDDQPSTVEWSTRLGSVRGLNITSDDGNIFQFRRIPFAKPPVGDLRFEKPEVPNAWVGTLDCTSYGHACMQAGTRTSEDCLYLNVYVPNSLDTSAKRAVMVWIHGGSFISGSGSETGGSTLALHGDVIVVTINYRLNIFGFFSTGDNTTHGNYGLWDQMLALRWVKDNIEDYGGNPSLITIFGESAGGVSVGLQAIITQNKDVFQRVIAESGSSVGPRDSGVEAMKVFSKVVDELGCFSDTSASTVRCLRQQSAEQLVTAFFKAFGVVQQSSFTILSALGPTIDGELFPKDFDAILSDHDSEAMQFFRSVDYLAGMNSADGGLFYFDLTRYQKEFPTINFTEEIPASILRDHVVPNLVLQLYDNCVDIYTSACDQYVTPVLNDDIETQTSSAENLYADVDYYSPAVRSLDAHIGSDSKTYQYFFSYEPRWGPVHPRPLWLHGANHADELAFVFGLNELYPSNVPHGDEELAISKRVMTYWTNFAKTGDPNGNDTSLLEWPPYKLPSKPYLNISVTDTVGQALFTDRMEFWNKHVPKQLIQCQEINGLGINILPTMEFILRIFIVCMTVHTVTSSDVSTDGIVNITYGAIQGKRVTIGNETVYQFLKLPFAKPPIGNLRFQKPQTPDSWTGILDASHHGPPCMQLLSRRYANMLENNVVSEDCLYLNVYVPGGINITANLSVMVYIHGGGYKTKTASLYDGSFLALHGNVIVVITNYRLGFFGFLSTEDESATGNYGLWDQIYALRWVQENIELFGGNPAQVTVFGHSAGGYSIGLLLLSTQTKDLFRRAIPMSGFGLSPRAITHNPRNAALRLAAKLGCVPSGGSPSDMTTLVDCMRNQNASALLQGQNLIVAEDSSSPQFIMRPAPVIDGEILVDWPRSIMYDQESDGSRRFLSADYMAGTNSADGGLIRSYLKVIQTQYNFSLSDGAPTSALCESIAPALARDYYGSSVNVSDAICMNYTSNGTLADQARRLVGVFGDMMYDSRAVETLTRHIVGNCQSYQFVLSHKSSFVTTPGLPIWLKGAYHGDELVYIFGMPLYNFSSAERSLSEAMMTYLTNFAKFGDPNGPNAVSLSLPLWPQFDQGRARYMDFDLSLTVKEHLHRDMVKFWLDSIPGLNKTSGGAVSMATVPCPRLWLTLLSCLVICLGLYI